MVRLKGHVVRLRLGTTCMVSNATLGANLTTEVKRSIVVILNPFSIVGGLAARNHWPSTRTGRGEQNVPIVHGAWCTRSNDSLVLVRQALQID